MSWSELRDSDADSPTTCRIARLAGCSEVEALGYQARLWCWTLRHAPTGDLGVSPEELEIALGWRGASGALASALLAVQAVEITDESGVRTVRVVGWESRCRLGRERARWQARAERARASAESPRSPPETPRIEERRGEEIRGDQIRDTVSAVAPTVTSDAPPERPRRQRAPRPVDDSPVLATLAVRDGELWRLTEARAQRLRAGYPAVDLPMQIARVDEWLTRQTNSHLPTARGMPAFLARWLSRPQADAEQRAGGGLASRPAPQRPTYRPGEAARALRRAAEAELELIARESAGGGR